MLIPVLQLIGKIDPPTPYGGAEAATTFLANAIRVITIGAGLYAMVNFVIAGVNYISSAGDPQAVQKAWAKIYHSLVGVAIVIMAFALAGVLGLLLFGDARAILSPIITGPGG